MFPENVFAKTGAGSIETDLYTCKPGCKLCDMDGYDTSKSQDPAT